MRLERQFNVDAQDGFGLFRSATLGAAITTFGDIVATVTCGRTFADKRCKLFSGGSDW